MNDPVAAMNICVFVFSRLWKLKGQILSAKRRRRKVVVNFDISLFKKTETEDLRDLTSWYFFLFENVWFNIEAVYKVSILRKENLIRIIESYQILNVDFTQC